MKLKWALQDDWLQLRIGQLVQLRGEREEKFSSEVMGFTSNGIRLLSLPTIWKTSYWKVYVQAPKTPKPKPIEKTLPTTSRTTRMKTVWEEQDDWAEVLLDEIVKLKGEDGTKLIGHAYDIRLDGIKLRGTELILKSTFWKLYVKANVVSKTEVKPVPTTRGMYVSWANKQVPTFFYYEALLGWNQGTNSETISNDLIKLYMPLHRLIEKTDY